MDATQTHLAKTLSHNSPLLSCRFSPSGSMVFAGSEDYQVRRFSLDSDQKTAFDTDAWVRSLVITKDESTLITAGYDGRLIWWPAASESPTAIRTVDAHAGWIRGIALSPDETLLASVGNDLMVKVWEVSTGKLIREMSGHDSHIYNVAFHPSGNNIVTGDLMGNLIDWEVASGKQLRTWKAESLSKFDKGFVAQIGGFRGLKFNQDGSQLLGSGITNVTNAFAGVGNPSVVCFDWSTGKQLTEHLSKGKVQGVAWGLASHPDGTIIAATGGSGGFLLFWKPGEVNEFHSMKLKDVGRDMDLSSDGVTLAIAHYNGTISVCRMEKPAPAAS